MNFGDFINKYIDIQNVIEEDIKQQWSKAHIRWWDSHFDFEDKTYDVEVQKHPCRCSGCDYEFISYSFDKIRELLGEE